MMGIKAKRVNTPNTNANEHTNSPKMAKTSDKTIIMIAHRLKTVEHADQILVLDQGRIVEQGKHQDLLAKQGIYSKFIQERKTAASWRIEMGEW